MRNNHLIDHTGQRIGLLTVLYREQSEDKARVYWRVRCDCGNETIMLATNLRRKVKGVKSCGCARIKHGLEKTDAYPVWRGMMRRCYDSNDVHYHRYGGRGISVCEKWHDVSAFVEDMGQPPAEMQIDRIDNDGNYSPTNCRWATRSENVRNSTTARNLSMNGRVQCVTAWAKEYGVRPSLISARIDLLGWDIKAAITTPARGRRVSEEKQRQIRAIYLASGSNREIGERYGLDDSQVSRIRSGKAWSWLTGADDDREIAEEVH